MIHVSVAFCPEDYRPKAQLPAQSDFDCQELPSHPPNLLQRMKHLFNSENMNVKIELDIFGLKVSDVLDKLKSAPSQGEKKLWIYRLLMVLDGSSLYFQAFLLMSRDSPRLVEEGQRQMIEKLPSVLDDLLRIVMKDESMRTRAAIAIILSTISTFQIESHHPCAPDFMPEALSQILLLLMEGAYNDSRAEDDAIRIMKFVLSDGGKPKVDHYSLCRELILVHAR